ncbi:MAG TPA: precorrin-6y C5,15-methyltransferase (decarboxylating) subunit CbiE [Desulfosarcina sp.]|nr:precorrin-6y C5,15-methyltransferase (decarboxylating) subunit CbiE [Desulfosarcina sp.]
MAPPVTIVGTGMSSEDLTRRQRSAIEAAEILVGGRRLLESFAHLTCETRVVDRDLNGLGDYLSRCMTDRAIVVLTSGDPLFYGIGAFLVRRLGAGRVRILPNVSAVAAAFARLGEAWQEVHVASLHGRQHTGAFMRRLAAGDTVAVYTDPNHDPVWLAGLLVENGFPDAGMTVFERMGTAEEKVTTLMPEQARGRKFDDLNLVVLKPDPARQARPALFPGMPDERFVHENGLITKAEVRAVSLSRLQLYDRAVFWDLGAGSGAVSVEAGLFVTRGTICAVEQNAARVRQIRENRARFGIGNMEVVQARLPDGLENLPDPDRVFIGGGGKDLARILRAAVRRLKPAGIIVVNTVLVDSLAEAARSLSDHGFATDTVQIQVNRARPMPYSSRLEAANPVWIITGSRP